MKNLNEMTGDEIQANCTEIFNARLIEVHAFGIVKIEGESVQIAMAVNDIESNGGSKYKLMTFSKAELKGNIKGHAGEKAKVVKVPNHVAAAHDLKIAF